MLNAILITGNTYPNRRQLRALGCLFDRNEMGYIVCADNSEAFDFASEHGLDVAHYSATEEQLTPASGERLREIRQDRIDRRNARLLDRADRADRRAQEARDRISPHEREFLSLMEPIKTGHHSERRHRKLIERANNSSARAAKEVNKAQKLRRAAQHTTAQIKGDAAKRDEVRREIASETISVGDLIDAGLHSPAVVIRSNAKSFTIQSEDTQAVFTRDKIFCKLLEKRAQKKPTPPRFKKGDKVLVSPWHHRAPVVGTVLRRTPKGYSVEFTWTSNAMGKTTHTDKATFQEHYLEPAQEAAA